MDLDVTKTIITAAIGFTATTILGWMLTRVKKATGKEPVKPIELAPHEEWQDNVIARSFWARSLRPGFHVSGGTRLLIIDAGVVQVDFADGVQSAAKVRDAFAHKGVGNNARALQYRTGPISVENSFSKIQSSDAYTDVECTLETRFQLSDEHAPALLECTLIRADRQITSEELVAMIEKPLDPWLRQDAARMPFAELDPYFNGRTNVASQALCQYFQCDAPQFRFRFRSAAEEDYRLRWAKVKNTNELDLKRAQNEHYIAEWKIEYDNVCSVLEVRKSLVEQLEKITEYDQRLFFLRQNVAGLGFFKEQEEEFQRQQQATNFQTARAQALDEIRRRSAASRTAVVELTTPSEHDVRSRDLAPQPQHSNKIMRSGEPLRIRVRSSIAGYLMLVNIGTTGALNILLPNAWEPSRHLAAGEVVEVPGRDYHITNLAHTPLGPEIIQAFVTPQPLFGQPTQGGFAFYAAGEMLPRIRQLCASLPDADWGEAATTVHVQ